MRCLILAFAILILECCHVAMAQPVLNFVDNGRGNVRLYAPSTYDGSQALPLIVGLHGFTGSGTSHESYFNFLSQVEEREFLYMIPDGTTNLLGLRFWNATDACCGSGVDDSSYLRGLVETVQQEFSVDDQSIHFTGHSNGGFMSHRMAIDHADMVASIASLAGMNYLNAGAFSPSEPVHVLQVHGTADSVIGYNGGSAFGPYPSAEQTVLNWVEYNGMSPANPVDGAAFDLDRSVAGLETMPRVYDPGSDFDVELWTLEGSGHSPAFGNGQNNLFAPRVVDWLLSHRKQGLSCDFDSNGTCDLVDLDALFAVGPLQAGVEVDDFNSAFDLTGDGFVDLSDRDEWLSLAAIENGLGASYIPGDANLDGFVDASDFNIWNENRFQTTLFWSDGNFNGDTGIDVGDFNVWNENKFTSNATNVTVVPEPDSSLVAAVCLLMFLRFRRTSV